MKQKVKEIALQAGGSHYPEVGGELLQKFADLFLAECIDAVKNADVRSITYTTFDKDRADSIKTLVVKSINERFKE
jgi:hypothetical protein